MSLTTNDLFSISKNGFSEIEQINFQENEINYAISLFILQRNFISFKQTTINL